MDDVLRLHGDRRVRDIRGDPMNHAERVLWVCLCVLGLLLLPNVLRPPMPAEPEAVKGYDYFSPYAPPSDCAGRQWVRHQSDDNQPWHECMDLVLKIAAHRGM